MLKPEVPVSHEARSRLNLRARSLFKCPIYLFCNYYDHIAHQWIIVADCLGSEEPASEAIHWEQFVTVVLLDDIAHRLNRSSVLVDCILGVEVVKRVRNLWIAWEKNKTIDQNDFL